MDEIIYGTPEQNKWKLESIPQIIYINMDSSQDRQFNLVKEFIDYDIKNFQRFRAYTVKDIGTKITRSKAKGIRYFCDVEYACLSSHIGAIELFYKEIDSNYCIICEDDLSFEFVKYWNKSLNEYLSEIPDFELLHLNTSYYTEIDDSKYSVPEELFVPNEETSSTLCYIISKLGAKKMLDMIPGDDKLNFSKCTKSKMFCADHFINGCEGLKIYSKNLLCWKADNSSVMRTSTNFEHNELNKIRNAIMENLKNRCINCVNCFNE